MRLSVRVIARNKAMLSARKRLGWSQGELARRACVVIQVVAGLEALDFSFPKDRDRLERDVLRVAVTLGLGSDEVMPSELAGVSARLDREADGEVPVPKLMSWVEQKDRLEGKAARWCLEARGVEAPEIAVSRSETDDGIVRALDLLPGRKGKIVRMFYGIGETPIGIVEIARCLGVSRARIRQQLSSAMWSLKGALSGRREALL